MNENGKDIDQQAVFDRLPLTAEQRKKLYAVITGAEQQKGSEPHLDSSATHDSPVQSDCTLVPQAECPNLQMH